MKKEIVISTTVTKSCYKEFLLLKFSAEQYHKCKWVVSCDDAVYDALGEFDNTHSILNIEKEGDHMTGTPDEMENFTNVILTKFASCEYSIKKYGYGFFLDSDIFFTNPLSSDFFSLLKNPAVEMINTPHYNDDPWTIHKSGFFNVGMFAVKNLDILDDWKILTENHKALNIFYEQKPQEFLSRERYSLSLPINYNIGWWRFTGYYNSSKIRFINLKDDVLYFGNHPAINFHVHTLRDLKNGNSGQFLYEKVFSILKKSNNKKYIEFMKFYDKLRVRGEH